MIVLKRAAKRLHSLSRYDLNFDFVRIRDTWLNRYEMTGFSCRFSTKAKLFPTRRRQRTITALIVGLLLNPKMV